MIVERMASALAKLETQWSGKRKPKAFYLNPEDWTAFMATNPPTVQTIWGNRPPVEVTDHAFENVPVRESKSSKHSRLYDNTTTGRSI